MSGTSQLPPKVQEKLGRLQQLQNTLQQLVIQKQRLDLERNESERALKVLEDLPSRKKVYKSSGAIMVEKEKDEVVEELEERLGFLEMRAKVLTKQENNTRKRLSDLQESLQKELNLSP
ncbi:MAG: prefoldin subunit beta [Candidatus Bathyarchaeota archaeon]|jgi:prefoldin beta subunit